MNPFDFTIQKLIENGYEVIVEWEDGYRFCDMRSYGIRAVFAEENDSIYCNPYVNGHIVIDALKQYDSPMRCPVILLLPDTDRKFNFIKKQFDMLRKCKNTTELGYGTINEYPFR